MDLTTLSKADSAKIKGYNAYKAKNGNTSAAAYLAEQSTTFTGILKDFGNMNFGKNVSLVVKSTRLESLLATSKSSNSDRPEPTGFTAGRTTVLVNTDKGPVDVQSYSGNGEDITGYTIQIKIATNTSADIQALTLIHELTVHAEKFASVIADKSLSNTLDRVNALRVTPASQHDDVFNNNTNYNKAVNEVLGFLKTKTEDYNAQKPFTGINLSSVDSRARQLGRTEVPMANNSAYNQFINKYNIYAEGLRKSEGRDSSRLSSVLKDFKSNFIYKIKK